jgi:hypothetical protein
MRDELSLRVERVIARKPERFQPRGGNRICAPLPSWQSHGDEHEGVFIQIIEACGITFQHALQLALRRRYIGVQV